MRARVALVIALAVAAAAPATAHAKKASKGHTTKKAKPAKPKRVSCHDALDALGVSYKKAGKREGIDLPVELTGALGGVSYRSWSKKQKNLVLDCSLVYSLALAGRYFGEVGVDKAWYSSAYQRRNVRGTDRPSNHSYGLALDIHQWKGPDGAALSVKDDFETGLGDDVDCIGSPDTEAARELKELWCRMDRSGLFRFILNPDSDADHYNHFHVEALPWSKRTDVVDLAALRKAKKRAEEAKAGEHDQVSDHVEDDPR